jgi:F420-dependent oxidoreductase-like protein
MAVRNKLKLSIEVGRYLGGNLPEVLDFVQGADRLGVHSAWAGEAWGQDSATVLAFLAGQTERIKLGAGIFQISARAPSMTAMTALSLNALSKGRFLMGLGVSGPQVVEGLHGVPYQKPLTRLRETVEICRTAFAGDRLQYQGAAFTLPLPNGEGKAIRLDHEPAVIPIYLATLGPKSLRYTGSAADGWLGTSFSPDHPEAHLRYIDEGARAAGRSMADINISVSARVEIGSDVDGMIQRRKRAVAFTMGGMGSAKTNFYNEAFQRAGYEDDALAIQSLWVAGKRDDAAARVPDAMVSAFQLIGTADMVRARLEAYRDAGVTTLKLGLDSTPPGRKRLALLEQIVDMVETLD